jgi:hypothetical protein
MAMGLIGSDGTKDRESAGTEREHGNGCDGS